MEHRQQFTLIEAVIVLAVIGLLLTLVLPKVGRLPRTLVIQHTISAVQTGFRDAGLRARTTGRPVRLVLDADPGKFRVEDGAANAYVPSLPPPPAPDAAGQPARAVPDNVLEYKVPSDVEWDLTGLDLGPDERPGYVFMPDGAAAGPTLFFTVGKTRFRLDVEQLTGRPVTAPVSE
jgi:type II secretory pathway pseudopilin PulG